MATDVSCIVFEIRRGGGGRSGGGVGTRLPFCCFFLLFVAFSCFLLPFVAFVTPACFSSRRRPLMKIRGTRGVFFSFFFSSLCWVRQQGQTMFGSGGIGERKDMRVEESRTAVPNSMQPSHEQHRPTRIENCVAWPKEAANAPVYTKTT